MFSASISLTKLISVGYAKYIPFPVERMTHDNKQQKNI